MREKRLAIASPLAREYAEQAALHLDAYTASTQVSTIAIYAPIRGELDTQPLAHRLRARGITICYPCMAPSHRILAFHAISDERTLVPNRLGIPEPPEGSPLIERDEVDLIVVPGLAFDLAGGRLGWGRAYYDTTLANVTRALRIGYAFEIQVIATVPASPTDERVDVIVTEAGARPTGARHTLETEN